MTVKVRPWARVLLAAAAGMRLTGLMSQKDTEALRRFLSRSARTEPIKARLKKIREDSGPAE